MSDPTDPPPPSTTDAPSPPVRNPTPSSSPSSSPPTTDDDLPHVPTIPTAWKDLLSSKKFLATGLAVALAVAGWILRRIGVDFDQTTLDHGYWALLTYVAGQSVVDFGKGAAQVKATTAEA